MRPSLKQQIQRFFETPETLCFLVSKLPVGLRSRWNRKVHGIRRSYGREPCLTDFSGFLNEETVLVNDLIFSREAVEEYVTRPEKKLISIRRYENLPLI